MTRHTTIVLGAGHASRFRGKVKYRLEVNGIQLIERLAEQIARIYPETEALLVTHEALAPPPPFTATAPGCCRWTCQTLLGTQRQWGNHTVVLLGDVRYRDEDLAMIYGDRSDFRVFTDGSDIFAISFSEDQKARVQKTLATIVDRVARGLGDGRLWRLCEALGFMPTHPVNAKTHDCYRILWKGIKTDLPTQDFDHPEELELFHQGRTKNFAFNHRRRVQRGRR